MNIPEKNIKNTRVAVVGAGIVGMCCALWLQRKGFQVTLVDGNEPGSMTSSGNACAIADYGCIPVNHPGLKKRLPALTFGRDSPLTVNPWYALGHLPWMLAFLRQCGKPAVDRTIGALGAILRHTHDGLDPLIALTDTGDLFAANGCMYVYASRREFNNARESNRARADQGVPFSELSKDEIYDLEPNLNAIFEKGIMFGNGRQVLNPKTLVTRFFQHFIDAGGNYVDNHAKGVIHLDNGLRVYLQNNERFDAHRLVISSGAFSRQIEGCDAEKLPLGTERGYHVQYAGQQHLLNRPVAWAECGFYATPMDEGLRFAGTVEIAGLSAKKKHRNLRYLIKKSRMMVNVHDRPSSDWLGFRPTLPDSLPVIGRAIHSPFTYYAFGHQHIGLTLAGITGKLICELVCGVSPAVDLKPYSPARFTRPRNRLF